MATGTDGQLNQLADKTVSCDPATKTCSAFRPPDHRARESLLLMMEGTSIKVALTYASYSTACMMRDSEETFDFLATCTCEQVKERIIAESRYSSNGAIRPTRMNNR